MRERALLRVSAQRAADAGRRHGLLHMLAQAEGELLPQPEEVAQGAVVKLPGFSDADSEGSDVGSDDSFTLRNIDFSVKAGELLCVTGRVGSGKSSLVRTSGLSSSSHASASGTPYGKSSLVRADFLSSGPHASAAGVPCRGTDSGGTLGEHEVKAHVHLSACCLC